jgi:hypothetical protein
MSKKKLAATIIACAVVIIVAIVLSTIKPWEGTSSTETYTLTAFVNPSGAGSISPSGGEYESGVQVTLAASPSSGYSFGNWSGSASGTASTITIAMDSDKSLTANFRTTPVDEPGLPEGWQTYTNEEYGFQFYYPEDWSEASHEGFVVRLAGPISQDSQPRVSVIVEPTTLTLDQYVLTAKQLLEDQGFVILSENDLTVSGYRGHEWIITFEWEWGVTKQKQVICVANGNAYILTCTASAEKYSSYSDTFDTMAESFVVR